MLTFTVIEWFYNTSKLKKSAVKLNSWTIRFHKVVWQQIWGQ